MKTMKKKIAVAVTVALLAFPLSTTLTMADTAIPTTTSPATITSDTTTPAIQAEAAVTAYEAGQITTLAEVATAEGLKAAADTAVAAVADVAENTAFQLRVTNRAIAIVTAKTALQTDAAVAAVAAYEAAPITTLAEVATAEGLKATADTAVATVSDAAAKTNLEARVTARATVIATAKTPLQSVAAVAAVTAYEAGPITTLAEVTTAEGLKEAADSAVAAVGDATEKTALQLRITTRAAAIATARTTTTPVVDANGNTVTSSTWFTDLIGKLQLALTFDPARKAELNERQALAKLAKAQELMKDGKTEAAQLCFNQYTDKITQAQAFLDQVKDPTSETAKTLDKALVNVHSNNIVVLGNLLDKLPPQAAQKLALNVVRTMEKAVYKIQKEEAKKAALETTPVVTPVVDNKMLEKQAKIALENFKKSLNQKGKFHIEDQEDGDKNVVQQSKPEQEMKQNSQQVTLTQPITNSEPAPVTVAPVKSQTAPTYNASENKKDDRNKQDDSQKNKGGDNQRDHR